MSIEDLIEENVRHRRLRGNSAEELRVIFSAVKDMETVIDIVGHGQRETMNSEFTCNGLEDFVYGKSYAEKRRIVHDNMNSLVQKGRAIVVSYDTLVEMQQSSVLHGSPIMWAEKAGKAEGRVCLNLSFGDDGYNQFVDREKSLRLYERGTLPGLADIAEMACKQQEKYPGVVLSGGTVDAASAYNLVPQDVSSAKLHCTLLKVATPDGEKTVAVIYLVGILVTA